MIKAKKEDEKILSKHFQNQLSNIKTFILSISLLLFIGSQSTLASTKESKSLISKFYELAEDKDANVRAELAETVGKTGKPEALNLLEKMATDKDPNVRKTVAEALGQTGRAEALKSLEKMIKNERKQKKEKQSSHSIKYINETAVKAIIKINKKATNFLAHYPRWQKENAEKQNKKRPFYSRKSYTNRLLEKNIYFQMIQSANNKTQAEKQAINLANQTKEKVFQLLNTLSINKEANIRKLIAQNAPYIENPTKALKLLEKIMKNEYKQSEQPHYSIIKEELTASIATIHHQATFFLIHLGNKKEQKENQKKRRYYNRKRYTGFYQQIIQYAKNKGRAENQAIHLANQTKKKAFQLFSVLAKDKSTKIRIKVVESIEKIKDPTKTLNLLEKMIKSENKYNSEDRAYYRKYHYTNVKKQAINSSIKIYKRANNFLAYLESQTETQKKKKRYSYRARGDTGIYNQMIQLSIRKKKAEKKAIDLAHQTKKTILQLLNTLAKDTDYDIRQQVVKELPAIDNLDAFNLLEKFIKDKETSVRKQIVTALEKINNLTYYSYRRRRNQSDKTVEKNKYYKTIHLLEKLAKDSDKGVRISAIKAMGKLNEN